MFKASVSLSLFLLEHQGNYGLSREISDLEISSRERSAPGRAGQGPGRTRQDIHGVLNHPPLYELLGARGPKAERAPRDHHCSLLLRCLTLLLSVSCSHSFALSLSLSLCRSLSLSLSLSQKLMYRYRSGYRQSTTHVGVSSICRGNRRQSIRWFWFTLSFCLLTRIRNIMFARMTYLVMSRVATTERG